MSNYVRRSGGREGHFSSFERTIYCCGTPPFNRLRRKSKFFGLDVWVQHFVRSFAHIVSVAVWVSLQLTRQATCYCC
jgi:hypothetical protein